MGLIEENKLNKSIIIEERQERLDKVKSWLSYPPEDRVVLGWFLE